MLITVRVKGLNDKCLQYLVIQFPLTNDLN